VAKGVIAVQWLKAFSWLAVQCAENGCGYQYFGWPMKKMISYLINRLKWLTLTGS